MYRAWCVATGKSENKSSYPTSHNIAFTGALVAYYWTGDNSEDFRRTAAWQQDRPLAGQDKASETHFKEVSDDELERQLKLLKEKMNKGEK